MYFIIIREEQNSKIHYIYWYNISSGLVLILD